MKIDKIKITGSIIVLLAFFSTACTQQEGIGGNSHIKGKIQLNYYNDDFSLLLSDEPIPLADEDVFLIFGNDSVIGEKTTTSNSGNFEYKYLWPGNYKLYYYADDSTGKSKEKVPVVHNITLGKDETLILDNLIEKKSLEWNEGTSSIKGTVWVINYKNSSSYPNLEIKDVSPAQDQDIYITYGKHPFYDERIRTSNDGTFIFQNLIKGEYKIFLYSEDKTGATEMKVIQKDTIVNENDKQYIFSDPIYIEKL
jgi:hypothetical protein